MNRLTRLFSEFHGRIYDFFEHARHRLISKQRFEKAPDITPAISDLPTIRLPLTRYASVVIPALNEAKQIAQVVRFALEDAATAEVIVIDDSSIDQTAQLAREAGARVVTSTMLGKGVSMQDGVRIAAFPIIAYMDGDLSGLRPGLITNLCKPLMNDQADFVKARFGRGGGRVTELTAKPMIKIFFPEIAHFSQPLGGIIAARKSLLQTLPFEDAYGVDIGLLIDAHMAGARLAEVDIGSLEHDSQPLHDLAAMANEVSRVILSRAKAAGRLHVDQVTAMVESQRQAIANLGYVMSRRKDRQKLLLIELDHCITEEHYLEALAKACGRQTELGDLVASSRSGSVISLEAVAHVFRFIHKNTFEEVAKKIAIKSGVVEFVNQMRRRGFYVGVVSDHCTFATEIIRRRVFADFSQAHMYQFDGEVCSGKVRFNPCFAVQDIRKGEPACEFGPQAIERYGKEQILQHFLADESAAIEQAWVVLGVNDLIAGHGDWLRLADKVFTIASSANANRLVDSFGNRLDQRVRALSPSVTFEDLLAAIPDHELIPQQDSYRQHLRSTAA
jgi:glucosyl-3-phosphoglycerate synthase